ncbi:helix-turn-helix domain-containing protein [Clostridium aciditolerans]|uniref:Helix-turn-helix transcriptional regulator n=1 Tax=Clostridium aciditolerans TaxID=339861 RepID=A0A934I039_9CLOT|nr:XRE family transcriptional regulator [Clostridium aciditolerans]MBI6874359.1 helix-turn-helix transcriptional regulator [Clostridium aciditolerans]
MTEDVGKKIKELRVNKNLTLKDLSAATNLSIGFLSQLERGLTTVAIDSLNNIAKALEVNLAYFLESKKNNKKIIIRSYEKEVFQVDNNQFIHYHLTNDIENKNLLPRLIEILPTKCEEDINSYQHEGEEFVYVLEGILTLIINGEQQELFPGDSAHYSSNIVHNWANYTTRTVKILTVHTPNMFKK